jgi:all-trans-retinol dehydrogenase (NAD+)
MVKLVAPTTSFYQCDLTSADAIAAVMAKIQAQHGHPTVLINNAGTINKASIIQTSDAELTRLLGTNLLAPYRLLQAVLPSMVASNHGIVVTVASVAGYMTAPGMVDYSMSKAAAVALHEGLSSELVSRYNAPSVRTICVVPNFVRTHLARDFVYESPFVSPMLEPEAVSEGIVAQILAGRSGWVIMPKSAGWMYMVLIRIWPWWMQRLLSISPSITEVTRQAERLHAAAKTNALQGS